MTKPTYTKHLSSSILLWIRKDKDRQERMNYWKGPHSKIISASPGRTEYRQIHLAENNIGSWPTTKGIEVKIPKNRKIDGIAEVTFKGIFAAAFQGKAQTKLAFKDEINVFERTILYIGLPGWSRWYNVASPRDKANVRSILYIRKRDDVSSAQLRHFIHSELVPRIAEGATAKELRTQLFTPWQKALWNSPNVQHDNAKNVQFHASVIVGFVSKQEQTDFFQSDVVRELSEQFATYASAIHAYDVTETLTFVKDGTQLPHAKEL